MRLERALLLLLGCHNGHPAHSRSRKCTPFHTCGWGFFLRTHDISVSNTNRQINVLNT
jgi:hypothetical protein